MAWKISFFIVVVATVSCSASPITGRHTLPFSVFTILCHFDVDVKTLEAQPQTTKCETDFWCFCLRFARLGRAHNGKWAEWLSVATCCHMTISTLLKPVTTCDPYKVINYRSLRNRRRHLGEWSKMNYSHLNRFAVETEFFFSHFQLCWHFQFIVDESLRLIEWMVENGRSIETWQLKTESKQANNGEKVSVCQRYRISSAARRSIPLMRRGSQPFNFNCLFLLNICDNILWHKRPKFKGQTFQFSSSMRKRLCARALKRSHFVGLPDEFLWIIAKDENSFFFTIFCNKKRPFPLSAPGMSPTFRIVVVGIVHCMSEMAACDEWKIASQMLTVVRAPSAVCITISNFLWFGGDRRHSRRSRGTANTRHAKYVRTIKMLHLVAQCYRRMQSSPPIVDVGQPSSLIFQLLNGRRQHTFRKVLNIFFADI